MLLTVLDLEMNSPTSTVIQIGAVKMDMRTGRIKGEFDRLVNPYEQLDPMIVDLCGITQEDVGKAPGLSDVARDFWAWLAGKEPSNQGGKDLAAWGRDVQKLVDDAIAAGVPPTRVLRGHDLKSTASLMRCALSGKSRGGLVSTLEAFGMTFEGRPHNALDDAKNTARLTYRFIQMVRGFREVQAVINKPL